MKRKYVLMVPVAAVTLWANSFGALVSAQSLQDINNNAPAVWQQDDQNKQNQSNKKDNKQFNKNNKQDNKNDKQVQKQQNPQVAPKAPEKQESVKKDKAPSKVTPETKEKRKVALANDYNNRKPNAEKPPVKKEDKKPLPPKDDQKPAPQGSGAIQVILNA